MVRGGGLFPQHLGQLVADGPPDGVGQSVQLVEGQAELADRLVCVEHELEVLDDLAGHLLDPAGGWCCDHGDSFHAAVGGVGWMVPATAGGWSARIASSSAVASSRKSLNRRSRSSDA